MKTSSYNDDSFLREHLPLVRATDDFETSVLALAALTHLPEAVLPESFEDVVIRQARQLRLLRTILYSTIGLGILSTIAYFMYLQAVPEQIPIRYQPPAAPTLLLPSEVTPIVEEEPVYPLIMQRVDAGIKVSAQPRSAPKGVTGRR